MYTVLEKSSDIARAIWSVVMAMAPYLLIGFVVAGVLSILLTPALIERHMGRRGLRQIVKASLLGVPLPLCSCGVIPVGLSLRRHGASRGATVSFLASTPQDGVDSIMASVALLGPIMAGVRVVLAFITGVLSGVAVERAYPAEDPDQLVGCDDPECCNSSPDEQRRAPAWRRALRHGFVVMPRDVARPLVIGIAISGALSALAPEGFIARNVAEGWPMLLGALLLSVPLYVCSTGSIPIAASFMHLGLSPGAALVFLVAGPATNAATVATVWSKIGRKAAVLYVGVIALGAVAAGWMLDRVFPRVLEQIHAAHAHAAHGVGDPIWRIALALLLLALILPGLWSRHRTAAAST